MISHHHLLVKAVKLTFFERLLHYSLPQAVCMAMYVQQIDLGKDVGKVALG